MRNTAGKRICQLCHEEKPLGMEAVCRECKPIFLRRAGCAFIELAGHPTDDIQIINVEKSDDRKGHYVEVFIKDRLIGTWNPAPMEPAGPENAPPDSV